MILYELLADRLPFDLSAKTPAEAASTVATEEPLRPSAAKGARGGLSSDLDALCLTAMEKDPRRRYATVEAVRTTIRAMNLWTRGGTGSATRPGNSPAGTGAS